MCRGNAFRGVCENGMVCQNEEKKKVRKIPAKARLTFNENPQRKLLAEQAK